MEMIYKYVELTEKGIYKNDIEIKNALEKDLIYKIEYGLYLLNALYVERKVKCSPIIEIQSRRSGALKLVKMLFQRGIWDIKEIEATD